VLTIPMTAGHAEGLAAPVSSSADPRSSLVHTAW
jgi:hypothetical protein